MDGIERRISPDDWPAALAHGEGPQLVVAGPGTGKSEFLVRRLAHLVEEGLAGRSEIALLTFSRRSAARMARRVESRIGATGVPVDVTTFHSLALRLVEADAGGPRPTPLTTPEQVGVVASLLREENPGDWPLPYREALAGSALAAEVADFLMRCSERLLSPEGLARLAEGRQDWRALPALYRRYLERLARDGRTDYGVLLAQAVAVLRRTGPRELHSFKYVLVDEYQDTTPAQALIADLLAGPEANLTVAADPYQSIYSFRGADVENVPGFTERHPGATRYVLSRSFRVPEEILTAALAVVSGGELPGGAGPVEPAAHTGSCEAYLFDQETAEAEWIAREVEHALVVEGTSPSEIAVLVRSKRELLKELSRALDRRAIPHDAPDRRLVDHPAVGVFRDLAHAARHGGSSATTSPVDAADADRAMRRLLLGPLLELTLGQERSMVRRRRRSWDQWADVVSSALPEAKGLASLLSDPSWATGKPAAEGFWEAWESLEGIDKLVHDPARSEWRSALAAFAQVLARQSERDPGVSLARFFELAEDEDFEATPLLAHGRRPDQVALTTLHQSKGLEFDLVFIANAVEGVFPDLRRSRKMLRPELLVPGRALDGSAQHRFQVQEEMRLAYTAMTRARRRVVWTATQAGVDQGERRPSRFLMAVAGSDGAGAPPPSQGSFVTISGAETELRRTLADPAANALDRLSAAGVLGDPPRPWWDHSRFAGVPEPGPDSPILGERIHLSPSQADAYRRCPRRYALERRMRLGDAASPYIRLGVLVHEALALAEGEIIGTGRAHAEPERALELLREVWAEADFGTPALTDAWLEKAEETLRHLYENWPGGDAFPVAVEKRVADEFAGVGWVGYIDRVEQTAEGLRVVDYKTGTRAVTVEEGRASIQLAFYALALEAGGAEVVGAELWYPRARGKSVTTRKLDIGRLVELREEMSAVTRSILGEDWRATPGSQCRNCGFKRSCPAWPEGRGAYIP